MTRDEAVAKVQRRTGFRSDKAADIIQAMKDKQIELELRPELPWFLRTEISSVNTLSGEERVPIPDKFIREVEDDALYYFNSSATDPSDNWVPLIKGDLEDLRRIYPGEGPPEAYALDNAYYRIFPTPDDAYPLKQIFYEQDEVLSSNIENLWLKHIPDLLVGHAGAEIAADLRDTAAVVSFEKMIVKGEGLLTVAIVARDNANKRLVIGGVD